MKAIVQDTYGETDVLELRDIPKPEPAANEALIRVHAAGLDQGVWHLMAGLPLPVRLAFGLRRPKNPVRGWDVAGVVEAVGNEVTRLAPGDEVFGTAKGSFAEYACGLEKKLAPKPASVTWEQAAVLAISGITALQGLRDRGKVKAGDAVLVIGASGGVGTYAVQIAKALGAEVTGVCSTEKVDLVTSIGADHVIDYKQTDFTTGERRYDVILDTGGATPLPRLRGILAPKGTLVIVGAERAGTRMFGGLSRAIRAHLLSPFVGQKLGTFIADEDTAGMVELTKLIDAGQLRPVIDRTFPLAEAPDAIRYMRDGRASGKVAIVVSEAS